MRKLATIRKIEEIKPIEGADAIQHYRVDGWWIVDKIGAYSVGDLACYAEIDSWLPHTIAPFLSKGKEPRQFNGVKGEKLRTAKLRGVLSQGLLLPINVLPNNISIVEGDDVTEVLNIQKWEAPIPAQLAGQVRGTFPSIIPKTDQERVQNINIEDVYNHTYEVTEKLHGCFLRTQRIETWDSGTVTIGDIVNKGIRPKLIGVDADGKIVPVDITNVFNNGKKDYWVDIKFETPSKSSIVGKSGKLRCTVNHKIFTSNMNEVLAKDLKAGDEIIMTAQELDSNGIHYIQSSMLGDGNIGNNGHFSYNEAHSTRYPEYINYIKKIFKNINISSRVQISGYGSEVEHIKVFKTNKIKQLRSEWYSDTGVKLPKDISWIDDFSIAKWYMDDGSLAHSSKQNDRANFATNSFCEADVRRLCDKLKELYCVDAVCDNRDTGFVIRINYSNGTIHNFWKAISPHIVPEQRYKLPDEYRNVEFKEYPEVFYERVKLHVKVNSVSSVAINKKNFPIGRSGYDIETTTHNYFCGGILVHNSSCTFHLDIESDFHVCSRNLDLKVDENNAYWRAAFKYDIEHRMTKHNLQGIAIQGELIGDGINGNNYKTDLDFYVFDVYDVKAGRYLTPRERQKLVSVLGLKHVPIVEQERPINNTTTLEELLKSADGTSLLYNCKREGFVFKSTTEDFSFKVISNSWLLKYE